jgi:putative nucleotidyltransferase with HDIG domain
MALACARTVVEATAERLSSAERVEELRLFVSAGQQAVTSDHLDPAALGGMVEEAVALIGGDAGAVLRPVGALFEVVARSEGWRGAVGGLLQRADTAPGRALDTLRTVVSSKGRSVATLAMPLVIGGRALGVLEVRLPASALPVEPARVARLDRFGRFISIALERDDERGQVERAMGGYTQLNELSAALGGVSDVDSVIRIVTDLTDRAFSFEVCGLVLSSWGLDRADVTTRGDVTYGELVRLLGQTAGRDVAAHPFDAVKTSVLSGSVVDGEATGEEWASVVVELEHGDLVVGCLFVASRQGIRYSAQDHALLSGIAAHAGSAFGRVALFTRIRDDYAKTIAALSATLDAGEHMPNGHSSRVMEYSMMIGEELGLPFEEVEQLRFAGLLHDIGKTGLPSDLLLKSSKLSAEELKRVRAHAELGASIVDQIEFLKSLTPIILHHHERYDGSGYPAGLTGEQIPLLARVLAVADSFDAMSTQRVYRKKLTYRQACEELRAQAGTQFEPRIVAALLEALEKRALAGSTGLLAPRIAHESPQLKA